MYRQFAKIFETFRIAEPDKPFDSKAVVVEERPRKAPKLEDDDIEEEDEEVRKYLKKKL